MKELQLGPGFAYPYFPPKDLLQSMASNGNFHKVLGVPVAYSDYVLPKFWEKYRKLYPQHDLFAPHQIHLDFKHLLPFYLHGDGGRTYRKDSILILSMYTMLWVKERGNFQPSCNHILTRNWKGNGRAMAMATSATNRESILEATHWAIGFSFVPWNGILQIQKGKIWLSFGAMGMSLVQFVWGRVRIQWWCVENRNFGSYRGCTIFKRGRVPWKEFLERFQNEQARRKTIERLLLVVWCWSHWGPPIWRCSNHYGWLGVNMWNE